MTEARQMTIKRGMTRVKTIKAQLEDIAAKIRVHGAVNDQKRHQLGDTKTDLRTNHNQAMEQVRSWFQQAEDLQKELVKIKYAIDKAGFETVITVAGKQMTIHDALTYRRDVEKYVRMLSTSYAGAVAKAQQDVDKHNAQFANAPEETKQKNLADVLYLVPREKVQEIDQFLVEFMSELDGILDETNAITMITIEE